MQCSASVNGPYKHWAGSWDTDERFIAMVWLDLFDREHLCTCSGHTYLFACLWLWRSSLHDVSSESFPGISWCNNNMTCHLFLLWWLMHILMNLFSCHRHIQWQSQCTLDYDHRQVSQFTLSLLWTTAHTAHSTKLKAYHNLEQVYEPRLNQ